MTCGTILMALGLAFAITPNPATLSGPITGGERGRPFAAVDVSDRGYPTEEWARLDVRPDGQGGVP